jgi:hypothetical protein
MDWLNRERKVENKQANLDINGQDNTTFLWYTSFFLYDRIPAYVGTLLSMCRNQHCTSHSKTKDLMHVEIKLKYEAFTKCLYSPL